MVIDERTEYANPQKFPEADTIIAEDFDKVFGQLHIDESSYIVIATRSHPTDEKVLKRAVGAGARYVGMVGSRKKTEAIFSHLLSEGIPQKWLSQVHTPIGIDINAETPEEIAVSILAEIIKVRRASAQTKDNS